MTIDGSAVIILLLVSVGVIAAFVLTFAGLALSARRGLSRFLEARWTTRAHQLCVAVSERRKRLDEIVQRPF
jgi:hypothetical protein